MSGPERDKRGYWVFTPHGTYSRYTNGGCRCDKCREANRIACWLRRNGLGPGRRKWTHGIGGYLKGCRCETCRAARSDWHRFYTNPASLARKGDVTSTAASSSTRAAPRGA